MIEFPRILIRARTALTLCASLLMVGAAAAQAPEAPLGNRARAILVQRCARCHGGELESPKGGFGSVEDLALIKRDWVEGQDPDETDLWMILADPDEPMPPKGQPESPIPAEDMATLRAWIEAGSPLPEDLPPGTEPVAIPLEPIAQPDPTAADLAQRALGKSHVLFVHFPVALIYAAFLAELLACFRPSAGLRSSLRFCLWVGALGAVAAAGSGWMAVFSEGYRPSKVEWHRWLGIATAASSFLAIVLVEWSWRAETPRRAWTRRITLLLLVLLLTAAAHGGGELVHGEDHFDLFPAR